MFRSVSKFATRFRPLARQFAMPFKPMQRTVVSGFTGVLGLAAGFAATSAPEHKIQKDQQSNKELLQRLVDVSKESAKTSYCRKGFAPITVVELRKVLVESFVTEEIDRQWQDYSGPGTPIFLKTTKVLDQRPEVLRQFQQCVSLQANTTNEQIPVSANAEHVVVQFSKELVEMGLRTNNMTFRTSAIVPMNENTLIFTPAETAKSTEVVDVACLQKKHDRLDIIYGNPSGMFLTFQKASQAPAVKMYHSDASEGEVNSPFGDGEGDEPEAVKGPENLY